MSFVTIFENLKLEFEKLDNDLQKKTDENNLLLKNTEELEDELVNLRKVSLIGTLTRQVEEKNTEIDTLNKQIFNLKKKNNQINKNDKLLTENEFETIEYNDIKLLKNIKTRKLYYIENDGSKSKYAGKESKNGKIKIKNVLTN